jgi:hypothetical protein
MKPPAARRCTQVGAVGLGSHVFYELACGVGMPSASVVGPAPAAGLWTVATGWIFRAAGRRSRSSDPAFAVLNGIFLAAFLAHMTHWPKRWVVGLPVLTECEGVRGAAVWPYNAILYVSGVAAIGGLRESGRAGFVGAMIPAAAVPVLIRLQAWEFTRLRATAQRHPAWWNRGLRAR